MALLTALWTTIALSLAAALGRPGGAPEVMERAPLSPLAHEAADQEASKDPFNLDVHVFVAFTELVRAFWGDLTWRLASVALSLALGVSMWAYAALVASSLTAMVPFPFIGGPCDVFSDKSEACQQIYSAYLMTFAVVVIPMSAFSFKEQRWFQVLMAAVRLLLVLCIVGDCLRMHITGEAPPQPEGPAKGHAPDSSVAESYDPTKFPTVPSPGTFRASSLMEHVAVAMAALTVHMVIPEAVEDLVDKPRYLLATVMSALGFCCVVYCMVTAAVAFTFGEWTSPVCTLNWVHYTAGRSSPSIGAVVFRSFLMLVPTVDVTGAYPVLASSLASTLRLFTPSMEITQCLRIACAACPILGAMVEFDLPKILGCVGMLMLVFVFVVPPMFILKAEQLCLEHLGAEKLYSSTYWRWHCDSRITTTMLVLGVVMTLAVAPAILGFDKWLF
jgi:hypothetical protein